MGNKVANANHKSKDSLDGAKVKQNSEPSHQPQPVKQEKSLFQHNPTQLARDEQGQLHPKWSQIVKRSQQKHKQKTQQLVQKIAEQTKQIGEQCIRRFGEDESKLIQCITLVAQPLRKIEKKGQQAIMGLGRTANKCLLSGKKEEQCIEEVRRQLHSCLESSLKDMEKVKTEFQ